MNWPLHTIERLKDGTKVLHPLHPITILLRAAVCACSGCGAGPVTIIGLPINRAFFWPMVGRMRLRDGTRVWPHPIWSAERPHAVERRNLDTPALPPPSSTS